MTEHKELNYDRILVVMLGKMMLHHQVRYPIIWHITYANMVGLKQYGNAVLPGHTWWENIQINIRKKKLETTRTNMILNGVIHNPEICTYMYDQYHQHWSLLRFETMISNSTLIAEIRTHDQQVSINNPDHY